MNETQLLNRTLELINEDGTSDAYDFLVTNICTLDSMSSQVYNFLYCLAATSNKKEEALGWLEEAILSKKLWYRPEVFEDADLDGIRDDIRFKTCCKVSEERCLEAYKISKSKCTWINKRSNRLILTLHGNQQNNEISKVSWHFLDGDKYQVEYLQSEEIDSCNLFRWEDDGTGPIQLKEAIELIEWNSYEQKILCGFSAGCNVILRAIRDQDISCNKIILQSPWIPTVEDNLNSLIEVLKKNDVEVLIICGNDDEDCLPQCKTFEVKAIDEGLDVNALYIEGLGHDYPENFNEIILGFVNKDN
ncbi:alpha/beta fold hydrolase [Brassicibacter mesophilus]|uniref:alpha/beta fold hydrolase n=1 Tax=Brassicibacter mesophilus TaxID=745119 RepID=UPI003D22A3BF